MKPLWRVSLLAALGAASILYAGVPEWWTAQGVIATDPSGTPLPRDDYAMANVGQAKRMAKGAYEQMKALGLIAVVIPSGSEANDLLFQRWENPTETPAEYAILNQGQLKYLAKPFYDRLLEYGYTGAPLITGAAYPWTHGPGGESDDDAYAPVNLGQLKYVFSFSIANVVEDEYNRDSDGDGIPDGWEIENGLDPDDPADAAFIVGGLANLQRYEQSIASGGDPLTTNTLGFVVYTP